MLFHYHEIKSLLNSILIKRHVRKLITGPKLKLSRCSWHLAQQQSMLLSLLLPSNTRGRNSEVQELYFMMLKTYNGLQLLSLDLFCYINSDFTVLQDKLQPSTYSRAPQLKIKYSYTFCADLEHLFSNLAFPQSADWTRSDRHEALVAQSSWSYCRLTEKS